MFLESFWEVQRFLIITDFTLRKIEKKVSTFLYKIIAKKEYRKSI